MTMKKQSVLVLMLFFSNNSYSSITDLCQLKISTLSHSLMERKLRIADTAGDFGRFQILKSLSVKKHPDYFQEKIIVIARKIGGIREAEILRNIFRTDPSDKIKGMVAESAGRIGGAEGIRILEELLKTNPSNEVLRHIVYSAGTIGGSEGMRIVRRIWKLEQKNFENVLQSIAESAGKIGGKAGADLLREIILGERSSHLSESTLWVVAYALTQLDKTIVIDILHEWLKHESVSGYAKQAIIYSAGTIGGNEGEAILRELSDREDSSGIEHAMISGFLEKIEESREN